MSLAVALLLGACGHGTEAVPSGSPSQHPTGEPSASVSPSAPSPTSIAVPKPPIVSMSIPFPAKRKEEMTAYAERHYGISTFRLEDPQVIVQQFTVSTTFAPVFAEFSQDVPDPELHELPGLCAHFVIDTDGTIYQLVPLDIMCRHTVGLNYTAIGIEHVGMSDTEILDNPAELAASLELTAWLMHRFHIQLRNVIGHNESLTSPFHRELVESLRCQTHGDWMHADMEIYRRKLAAVAERYAIPLGPPAKPVTSGC
jgi:beta-N-acetylhexosaminidase